MTDSEKTLWSRLRGKQVLGVQFYRQKPIGGYIVDFYAPKANLVIEIDGFQHNVGDHVELDKQRDHYLASLGLKVMRFNSRVVITNTDDVVEAIYREIKGMLSDKIPPGLPFPKGGRSPLWKRGPGEISNDRSGQSCDR